MPSSNLPTLYQNCLLQFSTELAKKAWLWFADRHDCTRLKYHADTYAREVDNLVCTLRPMLHLAGDNHSPRIAEETLDDLLMYILKRHANTYVNSNTSMWWE